MSVSIGRAVGYLGLNIVDFQRNIRLADNEFDSFISRTTFAGGGLSAFESITQSVGRSLTERLTVPLIFAGTTALKTAADFEKGMRVVQAVSGATEREYRLLSETAVQLGADTIYTARSSADAMAILAKAGWDATQIMQGLEGVMMAATASGTDLSTTADIVVSSLNAFGLEAHDASRFADILTLAANRTNVDISDLGESLKYIGPIAASSGISMEELTAALGLMGDAGVKGSQAGTTLRQALQRLRDPTGPMIEEMNRLGLSFYDSEGNMLSLTEQLALLEVKLEGATQQQSDYTLSTLYGTRAVTGLTILLNEGSDALSNMTGQLENSGGAAQDAADIMMNSLSGQIELLRGSTESLSISMGNTLIPAIRDIISSIDSFVMWLDSLSDAQKENISDFILVVAAIGPLLVVLSKASQGVKLLVASYNGLKTSVEKLVAKNSAYILSQKTLTTESSKALKQQILANSTTLNSIQAVNGKIRAISNQIISQRAATLAEQQGITVGKAKQILMQQDIASETKRIALQILATKELSNRQIQELGLTNAIKAKTLADTSGLKALLSNTAGLVANKIATLAGTVATGALTAAQWLLNAAMYAFPIMAVVGGVAALVGGVTALASAMGANSFTDYGATLNDVKNSQDDVNESLSQANRDLATNMDQVESTRHTLGNYATMLQEATTKISGLQRGTDEYNNSVSEVNYIVDRLNSSVEGLNLSYDSQTNSLSLTNEQLEQALDLNRELAEINALRELATETEEAYNDTVANRIALEQELIDVQADATLVGDGRLALINDLEARIRELQVTEDEYYAQLQEQIGYVVEAEAERESVNSEAHQAEMARLELLASQYGYTYDEMNNSLIENNITADEWAAQQEEMISELAGTIIENVNIITDGFNRLTQEQTISLEEYQANLEANRLATESWTTNVAILMDAGINEGIIAQLERLGPAGADQAARWVEELGLLQDGTVVGLDGLNADARTRIDQLNTEFESGFQAATQSAIDQTQRQEFLSSMDIAANEIAANVSSNNSVWKATTDMIKQARESGQAEAKTGFTSMGTDIAEGVATGIRQSSSVISAITGLVNSALASGRAAAKSASPSKLFRDMLGLTISQGVAVGVDEGAYLVDESMESLVKNAASIGTKSVGSYFDNNSVFGNSNVGSINSSAQNQNSSKVEENYYNFYGTPPLDEVEVVRQFQMLRKKMAESLM